PRGLRWQPRAIAGGPATSSEEGVPVRVRRILATVVLAAVPFSGVAVLAASTPASAAIDCPRQDLDSINMEINVYQGYVDFWNSRFEIDEAAGNYETAG